MSNTQNIKFLKDSITDSDNRLPTNSWQSLYNQVIGSQLSIPVFKIDKLTIPISVSGFS